jgi:hypothetical protein
MFFRKRFALVTFEIAEPLGTDSPLIQKLHESGFQSNAPCEFGQKAKIKDPVEYASLGNSLDMLNTLPDFVEESWDFLPLYTYWCQMPRRVNLQTVNALVRSVIIQSGHTPKKVVAAMYRKHEDLCFWSEVSSKERERVAKGPKKWW